ncbi:MAG: hypothetical protein CMP59_02620 [Flavobacteriales bacterium]|nr:hypothetical protein [Flavobacteriales bacterium]
MKKLKSIFSILVLLSLLLSTTGISVYKHYCGDFLASLSLYSPTDGCGDEDEKGCDESKMDCCDDETEFYQAELDLIKHEKTAFAFNFFTLPFESATKLDLYKATSSAIQINDRGPPITKKPLYITLSRLTYYG